MYLFPHPPSHLLSECFCIFVPLFICCNTRIRVSYACLHCACLRMHCTLSFSSTCFLTILVNKPRGPCHSYFFPQEPIGLGLYSTASYLNHSCDPTCVYHFGLNGAIVMKAIRDIKSDEQVTFAYVDLYQPSYIRQANLAESYFIDKCACSRCDPARARSDDQILGGLKCNRCGNGDLLYGEARIKADASGSLHHRVWCSICEKEESLRDDQAADARAPKLGEIEKALYQARQCFERGTEYLRTGAPDKAVQTLEEGVLPLTANDKKEGAPSFRVHPFHMLLLNTYSALTAASRQLEKWKGVSKYAQLIISSLTMAKLTNSAELADAYLALGDAYAFSGGERPQGCKSSVSQELLNPADLKKAWDCYAKASKLRWIAFGPRHPLTRQTTLLMKEFSQHPAPAEEKAFRDAMDALKARLADFEAKYPRPIGAGGEMAPAVEEKHKGAAAPADDDWSDEINTGRKKKDNNKNKK